MIRSALLVLPLALLAAPAFAGTEYEVTSKQGDKTITYRVSFGGGKLFERYTAYDPASKSFVYLSWPRNENPPEPVFSIWDHQTGRTLQLFKFPDVEHPLPLIPSIEEMKVCPKTEDPDFKSRLDVYFD
jgi:hypothetical protein